jgi:uncharacterized membrane protein
MTPLTYDLAQARLADLRGEAARQRHDINPPPRNRGITFENVVLIDRPVEDVFAYLADFTNIPSWNYYVTHVRRIDEGAQDAGATYVQQRRGDSQRYRVSRYESPRSVTVQTLPGERPGFTRAFELQPVAADTTRLTDSWHLDTGHPAPLQRLAASHVRKAVAHNLDRLKELLESGHTTLRDGRSMTIQTSGLRSTVRPTTVVS